MVALRVTAGYFRVLGFEPERGRAFDTKDELIETFCLHPANCPGLSGVPGQRIPAQINIPELFEVGVFAPHVEDGDEGAFRVFSR